MLSMQLLFLLALSLSLSFTHGLPQTKRISDKALLDELQSVGTQQDVFEAGHGMDEKVDIERMAELLCGETKDKRGKDDEEWKGLKDGASMRIGPMPLPGWLDSLVGEARRVVWNVGPRMRT